MSAFKTSGLRLMLLLAVLMPAAAAGGQSVEERMKVDLSQVGPQIGERVPDFSLVDQTGRTQTLQSLMGPNGLMLVFFRSADW
jgi:hypothetical protein